MKLRFFLFLSVLIGWAAIAHAKDMTFDIVYMNHTNIVVADGDITSATPAAFQTFLDTDPFDGFRFVVALNSPGGSLVGGMQLGQMIREQGLDTTVEMYLRDPVTGEPGYQILPGECYSSCAMAHLGGVRRAKPDGAHLGFHQFSSAGGSIRIQDSVYVVESTSQLMGATVLGYILNMGAKPELFTLLSSALPHEMWEPGPDELAELNIITRQTFQDFGFEPYGDGVVAFARSPENVVGRSVVGQVTAYCRRGVPHLLLSALDPAHGLSEHTRGAIAREQTGFYVSAAHPKKSADYGPEAVAMRSAGGLPIAELRLDADGAEMITSGPATVRINVPGVTGAILRLSTNPTDADLAAISAAFRLCIK